MPPTLSKYKAAVVASEPGVRFTTLNKEFNILTEVKWFDLGLSVEKTIHWINQANKENCKLVAFPETWIPGYPYWLWKVNYLESLPLIKEYRENSLKVDSEEMRRIRRAVKKNQIYVSLGFSEIDLATCYLAQVLIAPNGDIINHRRKIKPTHVEKLVFGDGAGDTFMSVSDTDIGRLGQLNCWENFNPFFKSLNAACGEEIHVAAWPLGPGESNRKNPDPRTNTADAWADQITPAYAMETCTWTLAPFQIISKEGVKKNTPHGVEPEVNIDHYNGFSRIYAPDGSCVAKADKDFEGLLMADIDLNETHLPKAINDFGGAYMRSDLIRLLVDTRRKELVTETGSDGNILTYSTRERLGLHLSLNSSNLPNEEAGLVHASRNEKID